MITDVPRAALLEAMEEFDKELRDTEEWSGWEEKGTYKYATAPIPIKRSRERAKTARTNVQAEVRLTVSVAEIRVLLSSTQTPATRG